MAAGMNASLCMMHDNFNDRSSGQRCSGQSSACFMCQVHPASVVQVMAGRTHALLQEAGVDLVDLLKEQVRPGLGCRCFVIGEHGHVHVDYS